MKITARQGSKVEHVKEVRSPLSRHTRKIYNLLFSQLHKLVNEKAPLQDTVRSKTMAKWWLKLAKQEIRSQVESFRFKAAVLRKGLKLRSEVTQKISKLRQAIRGILKTMAYFLSIAKQASLRNKMGKKSIKLLKAWLGINSSKEEALYSQHRMLNLSSIKN